MTTLDTLSERQEMVLHEIKKFRIDEGGHSKEHFAKKTACIMEALCLVLGYHPNSSTQLSGYLNPPCVSKTIKDLMVSINDEINNNQHRSALKSVAPLILNTAPTVERVRELKTKTVRELRQSKSNADYRRVERERLALINKTLNGSTPWKDYASSIDLHNFMYDRNGRFQKKATLKFITDLVELGKFENGALIND